MPAARRKRTGGEPMMRHPSGSDLDGAPVFIREIEIDVAGMLRQANTDFPLGTLKLSLRLKQIEG
jgi:hypothetical protein